MEEQEMDLGQENKIEILEYDLKLLHEALARAEAKIAELMKELDRIQQALDSMARKEGGEAQE